MYDGSEGVCCHSLPANFLGTRAVSSLSLPWLLVGVQGSPEAGRWGQCLRMELRGDAGCAPWRPLGPPCRGEAGGGGRGKAELRPELLRMRGEKPQRTRMGRRESWGSFLNGSLSPQVSFTYLGASDKWKNLANTVSSFLHQAASLQNSMSRNVFVMFLLL